MKFKFFIASEKQHDVEGIEKENGYSYVYMIKVDGEAIKFIDYADQIVEILGATKEPTRYGFWFKLYNDYLTGFDGTTIEEGDTNFTIELY